MRDEAEMRYLDSALREEIGGEHAPDLSERILSSASRGQGAMPVRGRTGKLGRRAGPEPGRRAPLALPARKRSPFGAIVAALLLFVAAGAVLVGLNFANRTPEHKDGTETSKGTQGNTAPREEPKPAPKNESPKESPATNAAGPVEPKPEEKPETSPKPDEVKKPEIKPEEKPAQPDEPKQPEGTEVKKPDVPKPEEKPVVPPKTPAVIAVVKELPRKNALKLRYAETEQWRYAETGEELREGALLTASGHADVQLSSGTLLRFNGEIALGAEITLVSEDLYVDSLDCAELKLSATGLAASVNGIGMFSVTRGSLSIACVQGSVGTSDGAINAGKTATLTAKGMSKLQPVNMDTLSRKHTLLRNLPQRSLLREDFEDASKDRLDKGEIAGGVATAEGKGAGVSIYFPAQIKLRAGDVVRFRYRVSRACEEFILQLGVEGQGNYRVKLPMAKVGEWVEAEFTLAELVRTLDKETKIEIGAPLKFLQLWATSPQNIKLELDWFEILRHPVDG
jgi:hypothetical protein